MLRRLIVLVALLAGVATATGLLFAAVALAPEVADPTPRASDPAAEPSAAHSAPLGGSPGSPSSPAPGASTSRPVSTASTRPSDPSPAAFHVGEPAPPLSVPRVGGGTIDLATLAGKPVWLTFTGSYCTPCKDDLTLMNEYAARYSPAGLNVVAVAVDEDEAAVAALATSLKITFPIGLDPNGAVVRAWGVVVVPVHYWIDGQGIVRGGSYGGVGAGFVARQLELVMPGAVVTP